MRSMCASVLLIASLLGSPAAFAGADPFDKWVGRNISEYLAMSEAPQQTLDIDAAITVYSWRWDRIHRSVTQNSGSAVNIGSARKPIWIIMNTGSNASITKAYYLNFYVSSDSGQIIRHANNLPKGVIRNQTRYR